MLIKGENAHGGDVYSNQVILDFSANISPLGTPQCVKKAVVSAARKISQYPDPYCRKLKEKISKYEKVSYDYIICGNGAADLIFSFASAKKPQKALIVSPAFSEYENALNAVGCEVEYFTLKAKGDFALDAELVKKSCNAYDVIFICNPSNPTGKLYDKNTILAIANRCKELSITLFLDECFMDLTDDSEHFTLVAEVGNNDSLFILKAFTKSFGMAGVRLGYALSSDEKLLEKMSLVSQVWNVSTVAQEAGCAALDNSALLVNVRKTIKTERKFLQAEFLSLGFKVYEGSANFLLFQSEEGLYQQLMNRGIMLRRCSNFNGLDASFYRCAVKSHKDNIKLIKALKERGL